jgi:hypothetical protein
LDSLIFTRTQRKQASGWLTKMLQKQTPLLTHCTNPRPLNCIGLVNSVCNSGVNVGILYGAGTAQTEKLLHVIMLHKFAPKFNQAIDWPHVNFNMINILIRNSGNKNRAEALLHIIYNA